MDAFVRIVLGFIGHLIVCTVFFNTAKFLLPALTFGKLRSKPIDKISFLDFPLFEKREGIIYLGFDLSVFFGFLLWLSLVLFIWGFVH
jgi:hypothetical protein